MADVTGLTSAEQAARMTEETRIQAAKAAEQARLQAEEQAREAAERQWRNQQTDRGSTLSTVV